MLPQEIYYLKFEEPIKSMLLSLRDLILPSHSEIETMWSYGMPFFKVRGKRFCYIWTDKKTGFPYIGFVNGSYLDFIELEQGNRSKMKIFLFNPLEDIPVNRLDIILQKAIKLCLDEN